LRKTVHRQFGSSILLVAKIRHAKMHRCRYSTTQEDVSPTLPKREVCFTYAFVNARLQVCAATIFSCAVWSAANINKQEAFGRWKNNQQDKS